MNIRVFSRNFADQRELHDIFEMITGKKTRTSPVQGTQVQPLVREDSTCYRATKLVCPNY